MQEKVKKCFPCLFLAQPCFLEREISATLKEVWTCKILQFHSSSQQDNLSPQFNSFHSDSRIFLTIRRHGWQIR